MITFFSKAMMKRKAREEKGFTLIELVVVISILGILAAMAVPRLSNFTEQARVAANQGTARSIISTVVALEAETGESFVYATNVTLLDGSTSTMGAALASRMPSITFAASGASDWVVAYDGSGVLTVSLDGNVILPK